MTGIIKCLLMVVVAVGGFRPTFAQTPPLTVFYEATTLPDADPNAPWTAIGEGNRQTSVSAGVLTLGDPDANTFNWFHRSEPAIQTSSEFHLAARVRILSNNGSGGTPGLAIYDYDAARPFYDFAHYWYSLHFFTDRVDLGFTDRDADTGGLLASVPVPDFATVFHDVELVKIDGNDRTLKVYLDGQLVVTITGQSLSRTLDGVGFGYGLYVGTGVSEWDYVRYSTESAGCPPGPVSNLMVTADKNAITWNPMGHAVFDLAYARITAPHFDGDFSIFGDPGDAVCQSGCGHAALSYQIGCKGSPPPGGFDFWLVRAHACLPGTWNDGVNQTASRDPMDGVTPISGSVCP